MHRNTLLLTALLAVIAALVIGVNIGRSISETNTSGSPAPTPASTPLPITMVPFTSTPCGVSLLYPSNLRVMETTQSGTIFANISTPEQSVIVTCQPDIPGVPLPPEKIESLILHSASGTATVSATLYHDASPKDGTPVDKLIFTNAKKGLDVFVGGYGATFQQIVASLRLIP